MLSFVIMRDRVTYAQQCVAALTAAGLDVVIVDHDSAWTPAREWLYGERLALGQVFLDKNRHPRDLWRPDGPIAQCVGAGERFIVTDCDVVPDATCPADWVDLLGALLDNHHGACKAALGLRTDDLPECYDRAEDVRIWESGYQPPRAVLLPGEPPAVWADVDTTLALYRRYEPFKLGPAIRTTAPYLARHLPWYEDTANPTPEQAFYAANSRYGHWRDPDAFNDEHGLGGTH